MLQRPYNCVIYKVTLEKIKRLFTVDMKFLQFLLCFDQCFSHKTHKQVLHPKDVSDMQFEYDNFYSLSVKVGNKIISQYRFLIQRVRDFLDNCYTRTGSGGEQNCLMAVFNDDYFWS